jgi:hypothetical protein
VWFVGNKKTFHPILDIGPHILKFDMPVPVFSNIFSLNMLLSTGTELAGNKILPEKGEKLPWHVSATYTALDYDHVTKLEYAEHGQRDDASHDA